jgi:DNA-binding MarR family transcriptional regulator
MSVSLISRLQALAVALEKRIDAKLRTEVDITYSQYKVLSVIEATDDGVSQKYIADSLAQTEASISRQVGLLKDTGLVTLGGNPQARTRSLLLTSKGRRVSEEATIAVEQLYIQLVGSLAFQEQKMIIELLDRLDSKI